MSLLSVNEALYQIHKPKDSKTLELARKRIIFNEFLFLQLGLLLRRNLIKRRSAPKLLNSINKESLVNQFLDLLPFNLTKAQHRVLDEIRHDLSLTEPMVRLVQGDVGSGKTKIALAALLISDQSNWQGAFMAPTEVLAQQHFKNLCK